MLEKHKNRSKGMKLLWLYFSLQGRISRKQYWMFFLIPTLIAVILAIIIEESHLASETKSLIEDLIILVVAWPDIAGTVKRYHDIDKSGWWFFINLIPIIGMLWCFIETAVVRGTEGNNRFGPNPIWMDKEISSTSSTVRQQPLSNLIDDNGRAMKWIWPTVWADEQGGWWKLLTTLALVAGGVIVGIFLFFAALVVFGLLKNESAYFRYISVVMVVGIAFGFGLAGLLIGIRQVHNKPVACVFTDGRPFNFRLAFESGTLWALMIFLYSWFWTNNGAEAVVRGAVEIPRAWWPLHLIIVFSAATLIQTSAAVLFWGYLQTRVGAWVKRTWLAVCISVLPFTLIDMIFSGTSAAAVSNAIVSGVVSGAACIRAGTLAPLVSVNIVNTSLRALLYPNTSITWSYFVFDALAMAIWFVWLLWATRRRP